VKKFQIFGKNVSIMDKINPLERFLQN